MAIKLRNRLSRGLDKPLAASVMFDYPSIDAISAYLLDAIAPVAVETAPPPPTITAKALLRVEELAGMRDTDIEALLDARLVGRR
jgi:hypothetical protein